jgi:4-diphosphocytidyl-2-C-methyl-D-erythritol kinase
MTNMNNPSWPSPAKLNLMLHIVGRRSDGYHLLQTVFQFLDHGDWLHFKLRHDDKIIHTSPLPNVPVESDLTVRAARLLQESSHSKMGVEISIDKQLPMGGGLGGGSSNAATTLVVLNKLWKTNLNREQLAKLGLQLGADVPVFIHGHAAWAEGVGEEITPITLPQPWFIVLTPKCHVSTAEVFCTKELTRNTPRITIRDFLTDGGHNDCLPVVRQQYREIATAINWLDQFAEAKLTGTGACIYASFEKEDDARAILSQLPPTLSGFVAQGLNYSPLIEMVDKD